MKLYQVTYYEDGRTVKAPGVSETELQTVSLLFAAESFEQVWDRIADIRADPAKELRAVAIVGESVVVLEGRK